MSLAANLATVAVAGVLTMLATGLGVAPFFLTDEIGDRWTVALWGLAGGIMLSASLFGLVFEGLREGTAVEVLVGVLAGVVLVVVADRLLSGYEFESRELAAADARKLLLIVGVLTVHSLPEGVAIGVAFADLGLAPDVRVLGIGIPALAVFMTLAISIQNVPEGLAIAIPLRTYGVDRWRAVFWAVFSSFPQPLGAVLAYYFVAIAREVLPYGFGFAAGAMIYLVAHDLVPEGLERGADLPGGGRRVLAAGLLVGLASMLPLSYALG